MILIVYGGWALMITLAAAIGWFFAAPIHLAIWAGVSLSLCLIGALMLASQPIGVPTKWGMLGSQFVRWGFMVGNGKLKFAVLISWMIWVVIGSAVMGIVQHRTQTRTVLIILAWLVDGLVLLRIAGIFWLQWRGHGRIPRSLWSPVSVLVGMITGSAALWWLVGTEAARNSAVWLAGGPPLLIGGGYGLFLLVMLTAGRKARWN